MDPASSFIALALLIAALGGAALALQLRARLRARLDALEARIVRGEATQRNLQEQLDQGRALGDDLAAAQRGLRESVVALEAAVADLDDSSQRVRADVDQHQRHLEDVSAHLHRQDAALQAQADHLTEITDEIRHIAEDLRSVYPRVGRLEREGEMRAELARLQSMVDDAARSGAFSPATAASLTAYLHVLGGEIHGEAS